MQFFALIALAGATMLAAQTGTSRQTLLFGDAKRSFVVHNPAATAGDAKRPLIITLHGDGGNAGALVDAWRKTADREGIVVMGPISASGRGWDVVADSPEFFQAIVETAVKDYGVDDRRVYLFGHSAGGHFALMMAVLEPRYFAGAVAHAGVLFPELEPYLQAAERKIPILLFGGRNDKVVPLAHVRATQAFLNGRGWNVTLQETNNDHAYAAVSGEVNRISWEMLKDVRLEAEPVFKRYARRD
jgi:poly(3-hydroxybutyrate) depolymerase